MSDNLEHGTDGTYVGRRHRTGAFPVVPAPPVARPAYAITPDGGAGQLAGPYRTGDRVTAGAMTGPAWFATEDGPAPKPQGPDETPAWVRALDVAKNVVVIVTCLAVLYTLWAGYNALAEFGRGLQQIQL